MRTLALAISLMMSAACIDTAYSDSMDYLHGETAHTTQRLRVFTKRSDILCVTGFRLSSSGALKYRKSTLRLIDRIRGLSPKTRITPLISLTSVKDGIKLLSGKKNSVHAADSISELIVKTKSLSIQLDLEYLPPEYAPKLASFLKSLRMRLKGTRITMAVFPQTGFPKKWSKFHDTKLIGPLIDEITVMCYDFHRPGTDPGPVTGIAWAERNIEYLLTHIPPQKIRLGIPAYGYMWDEKGKATAVSLLSAKRLLSKGTCYRHKSGTLHIKTNQNSHRLVGYLSDNALIESMTSIAKKHSLAGYAVWRAEFY